MPTFKACVTTGAHPSVTGKNVPGVGEGVVEKRRKALIEDITDTGALVGVKRDPTWKHVLACLILVL